MWADAQRDGRSAKYRWRPLLNATVWLTPTARVPCSNARLGRKVNFAPGKIPLAGKSPRKYSLYSVPLQEMAEHRAKLG